MSSQTAEEGSFAVDWYHHLTSFKGIGKTSMWGTQAGRRNDEALSARQTQGMMKWRRVRRRYSRGTRRCRWVPPARRWWHTACWRWSHSWRKCLTCLWCWRWELCRRGRTKGGTGKEEQVRKEKLKSIYENIYSICDMEVKLNNCLECMLNYPETGNIIDTFITILYYPTKQTFEVPFTTPQTSLCITKL